MLRKTILQTFSPLLSLFIFMLGNGLFNTLLTIRLHNVGASTFTIGLVSAAFYAGLFIASFKIEHFIIRVGHIRAFAVFASSLSAVCLLQGVITMPWAWVVMRVIAGIATAGLFVVIESWLLIASSKPIRGQVLALYMIALYGAQASGQFLLNLGDANSTVPFIITGILCSLSVIPLAMTTVNSPRFEEPSALNFRILYRISPAGMIGSLVSGLILGAIYGLIPLFLSQNDYAISEIAFLMATIIFGGMALQYPVGKISDKFDRRQVLVIMCLLIVLVSIFILFSTRQYFLTLAIVFFLFGGLTFTLYPVSISHACDNLQKKDITAATQGLLLAYSLGATVGPLLAPIFIQSIGPIGLFIYFAVVASALGTFCTWRKLQKAEIPSAEHVAFISIPQTTPIASELDPRSSSNGEKK